MEQFARYFPRHLEQFLPNHFLTTFVLFCRFRRLSLRRLVETAGHTPAKHSARGKAHGTRLGCTRRNLRGTLMDVRNLRAWEQPSAFSLRDEKPDNSQDVEQFPRVGGFCAPPSPLPVGWSQPKRVKKSKGGVGERN